MREKIAAQLYTLRDELKKDFVRTLRELKKMGWNAVQIDGLHGTPIEDVAAVMKELGIQTAGIHVSPTRLNTELDEVLREAELLGTKDIICPYLPDESRNAEGFKQARVDLLRIAEQVTRHGYCVGYHNHDFELNTMVGNVSALEHILGEHSEFTIYPEFDVYWLRKAGHDPLTYIKPYAKRLRILHLKDMTNDERETFTEIGTGRIDFQHILSWCATSGISWYAVEQDVCEGNPFDSLSLSLENLTKIVADLGV